MAESPRRTLQDRMSRRESRRAQSTAWTTTSQNGVVVTAHYLATAAGAQMLNRGGDAVDAAVAASLALGVCEPASSGLGGMTMMMVHRADSRRTIAFAGACRAPEMATPDVVAASKRYRGYRAVAVPANPAVLERVHSLYGRLSRAAVFAPAIEYAEDGYRLTPMQHLLIRKNRRLLRRSYTARIFLDEYQEPLAAGTTIRQPPLAATLRRLAEAGFRDFYEGEIGRRICEGMARNGGFIRAPDLKGFPAPEESEPLATSFNGLLIQTMGPPAGGIALVQMLNLFEQLAGSDFDPDSPEGAVLFASIIRRSRLDRRRYRNKVGADSVADAAELLTQDYASRMAAGMRSELPTPGGTSHVSVVDAAGNIVSLTQSIERSFGAVEIHPELGFLYNGFLRGFKIENERHPHYLRPSAVARSNSCPTVVLRGGEPWGAIGNTGSERLASGIFQVLARLRTQTPFEAVHAPRLHATPEGGVMLEQDRFQEGSIEALVHNGFRPKSYGSYSFKLGGLNLVAGSPEGFTGVADPRRDGAAAGPDGITGLGQLPFSKCP